VERALGTLVPVVIDFLAGLVGLGDLPKKVVEVIKAIQTRVLGVVEAIVAWLVERGRALLASLGLGGEDEAEGAQSPEDIELGSTERFPVEGATHRLWVDLVGETATLMVASVPLSLEERLDRWDGEIQRVAEADRPEAQRLLGEARTLHGQAAAVADELAPDYARAQTSASGDAPEGAAALPSDDHLERKQERLAGILRRLFELFGETDDPEATIADIGANLPRHGRDLVPDVHARWLADQVAKITITANSTDRVWTDAVLTGTDTDATAHLNERATHETLVPYFSTAPGTRSASAAAFGHYVLRARDPDPIHGVRDQFRTALGDAAATELRSVGAQRITPDVNEELSQIIGQIAYVVGSGHFGRFSPFPALDGVYPHLRAAVLHANGIIGFMRDMVDGGRVGALTWTDFATVWANGGRNVAWVKDQFRSFDPGQHEWIPTDMFREVLGHAVSLAQADRARLRDALDWITVYNELRSPTNHVIYRIIDAGGALAPAAHVGAFYEPTVAGEYVQRGTATSKEFHDLLRAFWRDNRRLGPAPFVRALLAFIRQQELVWDGDLARIPAVLHDQPVGFHYRIAEAQYAAYTVAELARIQRDNYARIEATFDRVLTML
jgi:hypothetical protein